MRALGLLREWLQSKRICAQHFEKNSPIGSTDSITELKLREKLRAQAEHLCMLFERAVDAHLDYKLTKSNEHSDDYEALLKELDLNWRKLLRTHIEADEKILVKIYSTNDGDTAALSTKKEILDWQMGAMRSALDHWRSNKQALDKGFDPYQTQGCNMFTHPRQSARQIRYIMTDLL